MRYQVPVMRGISVLDTVAATHEKIFVRKDRIVLKAATRQPSVQKDRQVMLRDTRRFPIASNVPLVLSAQRQLTADASEMLQPAWEPKSPALPVTTAQQEAIVGRTPSTFVHGATSVYREVLCRARARRANIRMSMAKQSASGAWKAPSVRV